MRRHLSTQVYIKGSPGSDDLKFKRGRKSSKEVGLLPNTAAQSYNDLRIVISAQL
jgi:hypothetical protein